MPTLERILELQLQNPEVFQGGMFLGIYFVFIIFLFNVLIDLVAKIIFYIYEKSRAIKIENDKKDPPKKLFASLFKKREDGEK